MLSVKHILAYAVSFNLYNCAAKLPREVISNKPSGEELALNAEKIDFELIESNQKINLKEYMNASGLTHMLLTFGSENCSACMEKTRYLQANLVGHYELVEGESGHRFEVVGVNVDPEDKKPSVAQLVKNERLTHLRWQDPSGLLMMKYFQPSGMTRSVPLSVMINTKGIMWRIPSTVHMTPKELIEKVALSLGQEAPALPEVPVAPPVTPIAPLSYLAEEIPDRLNAMPVKSCVAGSNNEVQTAYQVLSSSYPNSKLKFILVDKGDCNQDSVCASNQKILKDFSTQCGDGKCSVLTAAQGLNESQQEVCGSGVFQGGAEVFETFQDHFSWNKTKYITDFEVTLEPNNGPLTLGFDESGVLVYSKEGLLDANELNSRWTSDAFTSRAAGPSFVMAAKEGSSSFADWRFKSKWSVVIFWDTFCEKCMAEITEWHHPNGLMDFCDANPKICQVSALNKDYRDGESQASIRSFIESLEQGDDFFAGSIKLGWRIPHVVDGVSMDADQRSLRWFDSWLKARFFSSPGGPGITNSVILYDQEGKVRGIWPSGSDSEAPLATIKKLEGAM